MEYFIGKSNKIKEIKDYAQKISSSPSPVLIYGETGTGKEVLVKYIHDIGNRRTKPLISQNCAAVPANLLESILFGTVKGAFTEARDKKGLFELADGGILYLDELNSMPVELQGKLLRVLEDGVVRRIGDLKEVKVDVRVIASTNVEPEFCIEKGLLRRDLFYRLSVFYIKLPELKDRKEDIIELCNYFINIFNKKFNKNILGISQEVLEYFYNYDWPGNIRELKNVIEAIINIKDEGFIETKDLPDYIKKEHKGFEELVKEYEKRLIEEALSLYNGNVSKAANFLKVPRQTLQYKIKKLGI
ncbi:MAG: sigma 54-interacting transcriptional regulator [Caloramator sp.]|nr:sigma 54-interacting transcriptional regulator [Caloramator sp.]